MATVEMPAWAVKTTQDTMASTQTAMQTAQTAHKATSEDTNTKVTSIKGTVEGLSADLSALDDLAPIVATSSVADFCIIDVQLNPPGGSYDTPTSTVEQAELLNGAYIAVHVDGIMNPVKGEVTALAGFKKRFIIPATTAANEANVVLHLGASATCAYVADEATVSFTKGAFHTVTLLTTQLSGLDAVTEIARCQPWESTAPSSNSQSYILVRTTTRNGTRTHFGHFDQSNNFISDAGVKVSVWETPETAESIADCTEIIKYGSAEDVDILTMLKVFSENRVETVNFVGTSETVDNKFARFSPVYVKLTKEVIAVPVKNADNETVETRNIECVCRWFCDTAADPDYHLHSAFCRYVRDGNAYTEEQIPYCYIARYPIQHRNLTAGGASRAIAVSRSDGSNEVGNTRQGFLDRCKNVNFAQLDFYAPGESEPYLTVESQEDLRAASMMELSDCSLVEDLALLLFGVDSQSGLRGVSEGNAYAQQANGKTDFVEALGVKLGGVDPASSAYNFNFLGIEGGTWSAPGCMFSNLTSVMERINTTDAEGTLTSTTRNRYLVAIDRLDYNPGSGEVESLLAGGYRWVSFNVGGTTRVGLDDSLVMRDAKIFSADKAGQANINYAGVDNHWQGGAPGAIATYSASATYTVGSMVVYGGKLYECATAVETAEAFDAEKWTLRTNAELISRAFYMVARGYHRVDGASLGAACLFAFSVLADSNGSAWRSRLSLKPLASER